MRPPVVERRAYRTGGEEDGPHSSSCRYPAGLIVAEQIGSSENRDRFMSLLLSSKTSEAAIVLQFYSAAVFGGDVRSTIRPTSSVAAGGLTSLSARESGEFGFEPIVSMCIESAL